MSKFSRAFAVALLAASLPATVVLAQQADTPAEPAQQTERHRGPSDETMSRLEDGRIAMAKAALKLTPEQEKLWAPVEENIRANYAERRKTRDEWRSKWKEHKEERKEARKDGGKRERLGLPERLEKRSEWMEKRASKLSERAKKAKEFAGVMKPFYDSLNDEQKEVAAHVLRRVAGEGHGRHGGRHHGWRMAMGGGGHGKSCH
jgi:hypothetical protein